ncbi:MAG: tRNA (adenosine(37)-N6)-threonylcarbamoyltransferase complex transferase subunit TsaD [Bacteroidetes bacterium]|nr:tRNA (adenosine(37)-N6)-threonylcarbamoyltransferase complex transferase subunit TsaD [Bacteroidota bacterium]
MNVLGIESSCDETSVAVIVNNELKANLIASQDFHFEFGGVVPELSSRAHLQIIAPLLRQALKKSNLELKDFDLITSTAGPGLIGAVLVGLTFAKGLAFTLNKPFVPVNHIEGHIFSGFLMESKPEFPFLSLVVSGGHTLLLVVESEVKLTLLGTTIDDAAGEAFDKVSKMIGLGYPGGPKIQFAAENGDGREIKFPVAKTQTKYDFSFSGLKTSVLRHLQNNYENPENIPESDIPDLAASFQYSLVKALAKNIKLALDEYKVKSISIVGGVAANAVLRNEIQSIADTHNVKLVIPGIEYCGDNAAMIALRGQQLHMAGRKFDLSFNAFPSFNFNDYGRKSKRFKD